MRSRSLVLINGIVSGTSAVPRGVGWLAVVETDAAPGGATVPPACGDDELFRRMPVRTTDPAATMPINAAAATQAYIRRRVFVDTCSCGSSSGLDAATHRV